MAGGAVVEATAPVAKVVQPVAKPIEQVRVSRTCFAIEVNVTCTSKRDNQLQSLISHKPAMVYYFAALQFLTTNNLCWKK